VYTCVYYPCGVLSVMGEGDRSKKDALKRDQALHEATHGQFGEEPRPKPMPPVDEEVSRNQQDRIKTARKKSRSI
jgi:hypothetical protein